MLIWIIFAVLLASLPGALYYGYRLAFYYEDPQDSPYAYTDDDQSRSCKAVLDQVISEFEGAPWKKVSIRAQDGKTLTGRYYHLADNAPLEIQCHGYKGNAIRDFAGSWQIARELKHNVLLIDQRCHGGSEGHTITFGILERQDCLSWVRYANDRFGPVPVVLLGVSMGAATVLMASGMDLPKNVKAVIADCPYDAPANIIQKVLGQDMGMPVKLVYPLIRLGGRFYGRFDLESYSPVEAVKQARVPILLIHGSDDRFVPHAMSCRIHASAPENIEFHTIDGAGHALNYAAAPEAYRQIVLNFLKRCIN